MRIAAVAYHCERMPGWVAHEAKWVRLFEEAQADLVVLPEYAAMEAALLASAPQMSAMEWCYHAAERAEAWRDQAVAFARRYGCHVMAGSGPFATGDGMVNRAWLVGPGGEVGHQDKLIPTPYEREVLNLSPGKTLRLFDTALGRIGVLVCYDSEFPLLARALAEAGADMILVPSCTDLPQGQTRVRVSARARAVEQQCLVVQAPLVGAVSGCDIIDVSTGRAGIFVPPDHGLPEDGILAQGETDRPGVTVAEVDPAAIRAARTAGQVGNFGHWPEQDAPRLRVETCALL